MQAQIPDMINASFELLAGIMVLNNCRMVIKDKAVAGVSIISTAFFTLWGMWNVWYYPYLGQTWSFYFGIVIMLANLLWVCLMIKYRKGGGRK